MSIAPAHTLPAQAPRADPPPTRQRLWLALHFHGLPLCAATDPDGGERAPAPDTPVAVLETVARTQRVIAVNAAAVRAGIGNGMKPGEARGVCPVIRLTDRDRPREQAILAALADALEEFSAEVAVAGESALVMEAGRSLKLFGGVRALLQRLEERLRHAPDYHCALAPTAGAAALCARGGLSVCIEDMRQLRSRLGDLPVTCLDIEPRGRDLLGAMGIATLRDLLRLPRRGLARRLGPAFVRQLDELLGERPHFPVPHRFTRRFTACLHLDEETADSSIIMQAANRLLGRLERRLRHCDSAVNALRWTLEATHPRERLVLDMPLATPAWRADGLAFLLRLRLESVTLAAPVRRLSLASDVFASRSRRQQHGIPGLARAAGQDHEFIDRLRARLGERAVRGICALPEHRPEHAWSACEPGTAAAMPQAGPARPLWLLPAPSPLFALDGQPRLDGALRLYGDTERIRCGWWDGRGVFRDYRQALTRRGQRLWVFHEPPAGRWYLHGVY